MNKTASKEPSMDEILSSIRQIIADEDEPQAGADSASDSQDTTAPDSEAEADQVMMAVEETAQIPEPVVAAPETTAPVAPMAEDEPFSLSFDQMVAEKDTSDIDGIDFSPASSGMDSIMPPSKEPKPEAAPVEVEEKIVEQELASPEPEPEEEPVTMLTEMVIADDIAFDEPETEPTIVEEPSVMPDPDLSADIADKLLEPATTAAVGSAFSKLGALAAIGGDGITLDAIVREMLRPMLKEWLDENLPATVERLVEKEIERVSRGS